MEDQGGREDLKADGVNGPHKIGVIGTGMLGGAVATRLLEVGYEVVVYNRTVKKTEGPRDAGASVLQSPAEVAGVADLIIIAVRDADAVEHVSFGTDGLVNGLNMRDKEIHSGPVVADMSTIDPHRSAHITEEFFRVGVAKLDVPVMGGPDATAAGRLTMMVSGRQDTFDVCKGVFEGLADKIFFLGTKAGTAHTVKLGMNMQITMLALSLSEGITIVGRSGVDPKKFLDVLNATYFGTGMSRKKAYRMIDGMYKPTFTLANLRKDIGIMTEAASRLGVSLPMTTKAQEIYEKALASGFGDLDYTGIIRQIQLPSKGPDCDQTEYASSIN